jgi:lanthanide-dependent methanol dehydrogenase
VAGLSAAAGFAAGRTPRLGSKEFPQAREHRAARAVLRREHADAGAGVQTNYIEGTPYVGAVVVMKPGPGGNRGELTAWDPIARKPVWQVKEDLPAYSGALATAGNLVFYGTMDGWFKAVDAKTGELKWRFKTGSGIIGQPIAFKAPDGHEEVAILSGVGGWAGAIVSGNLDPNDPTGALGYVGAMGDLKQRTTPGGMLYVFDLPH